MKKYTFGVLIGLCVGSVFAASNFFTDRWTILGTGSLRNTAVAWIDSAYDFFITDSASYTAFSVDSTSGEVTIYNGDLQLGSDGTAPDTSSGGYYGIKVPFTNASGQALTQGHIIVVNSTGTGTGKIVGVTSTTTILGVCEGTVAAGAVGYATVAGYALVLTTGTVLPGDVIVSSNPFGAGAVLGYGGADATPDSGADVGVAMSAGTAAGGLTLIRVR